MRRTRDAPSSLTRKAWHRLGDVLDLLVAHRLEAEGEFLLDFPGDLAGDADAAGVGELFEPCGDVDALAIAVVALDDHLAEIDADAHLNALIFRNVGVALGQSALQAHRAFDRIDDRAEFGQHAVAHQLEDAPVMARDLRLEQFLAPRRQPLMGALLVALHERRVADHIGGENGGELAFHDESRSGGQEEETRWYALYPPRDRTMTTWAWTVKS